MDNRVTELRKLLDASIGVCQRQLRGLGLLKAERDGAREVNKQLRAELNTALNENERLQSRILELESRREVGG